MLPVTVELPKDLLELLERPSICYLATLMPDGSPHVTQTWVDTDRGYILINTVQGHQKVRNIARDPRVAVSVSNPEQPARYFQIRGQVVEMTTNGAAEHIDTLSERYLGRPYPWFGGREQIRVLLRIEPRRITPPR